MYDQLPSDLQEILVRNGRKFMEKLTHLSRKENRIALEELQKRGLKLIKADPKDVATYAEVGRKARRTLVGKFYSEEFLNNVEKTVADVKKNSKGGK
jgi:TRAP-type C4-dicarboxylate transport system substrate-binding protein